MSFPAWWPSHVQAAVSQSDISVESWTHETDVVVVGYGGAGVCTALEAAEAGLSVIAIDRACGGGATRINGGVFYAGGGTTTQKAAGVEDSVEAMYDYLKIEADGVVSDETLRRFCEGSTQDHDWLQAHGVGFKPALYSKKTSYPPLDYYLYHSDSSLSQAYADHIKPAARGHRVDMPAGKGAVGYGRGFYDPLKPAAKTAGVELLSDTIVEALVRDDSGRVVGVQARRIAADRPALAKWRKMEASIKQLGSIPRTWPGASWFDTKLLKLSKQAMGLLQSEGEVLTLRARRGVVLAAGGHVFNRAMVGEFAPDYIKGLPLGTPGDDGSSVALGLSVGAATSGMERMSAWRFINPPISWSKAPLINSDGNRFIDETLYGAAIGKAMCDGRDGKAWIILDQALLKAAKTDAKTKGILNFQKWPALAAMTLGAKRASNLSALAKKLNVPAHNLETTISTYNAVAKGEQPDPFNKRASDIASLGQGPYYAIDMSIDAPLFPLPSLTLGGLDVDEATGQVRREGGAHVEGLYAAGRSAVGVCSNLYVSGLSVSDCVFSGRRAAKSLIAS